MTMPIAAIPANFEHWLDVCLVETLYDPCKFSISTGDDAVLDDLFSYQVYNKIKNHWYAATAPADVQNGMIYVDSDNSKVYAYDGSAEEVLQATRSNDVDPKFAGVKLKDTGGDHYLEINSGENLAADRILQLITGDAARIITLSGNPTMGDWFDQAVK